MGDFGMIARVSVSTTRGVRKLVNEDRALVGTTVLSGGSLEEHRGLPLLAAVFDGVSQGGRGSDAAGIASAVLAEATPLLDGAVGAAVMGTVYDAMEHAQAELSAHQALVAVGTLATTVSGLSIDTAGQVTAFNAGDSRVYRLRREWLLQLTDDDTVVQSYIDAGVARESVERMGVDSHVITRAIGIPEAGEGVVSFSDCGRCLPGDVYLLCTDGVSGVVDDEKLARLLGGENAPGGMAHALVQEALANESQDNVSAIVVEILEEDGGL